MASVKPLAYEEERQRIIEENKLRMQELGIFGALEALRSIKSPKSPRKTQARKLSANLVDFIETRRSTRAANLPKVDYKEGGIDLGLRRMRGIMKPMRRGYVSPAAKTEAAARAGDLKTDYPSFVKAMLKSHTSGGFWLGLPCEFCSTHFTKDDLITLEDEDCLEWECVYLHHKHGLSGGWRGFSIDHCLEDGDAVVFELVTSTRFKVHITRAKVSGELSVTKTAAVAKKKDYQYVVKDSKNVHVHSVVHKALKREKGEQVLTPARGVPKQSKSAKPLKRPRRNSRRSWSSAESQESEEDESQPEDVNLMESKKEMSDDDIQPATHLKEKVSVTTRRLQKSKQHIEVKVLSKSRQVVSQSSKASMKVVKQETFVRRGERKSDLQMGRKEVSPCQTEQKRSLPPGSRIKPVGVCSIARGSVKRKLPAMYPARKYSFFSDPKSVKVS